MPTKIISPDLITQKILYFRGHKVMLDADLSLLYGVTTKRLNEQIKRNQKRFPSDFMFRLNDREFKQLVSLRSQFATSKRGGRRYQPYVFTEQGVAMLSSVLNSDRAIEVNIQIMRAFVKLRELMLSHKGLANKIEALEHKYKDHDEKIVMIYHAIKQLIAEDERPKKKIGFH